MCGICGFAGMRDRDLLRQMMAALHHRGPDEEGAFESDEVSLGHRRLSIIDLSTGTQPIYNEDRTIAVVFNGEIYNYLELRRDLEKKGHRFQTQSDTEVIVHSYEERGVDCLEDFNGEFALALWDLSNQVLFLARDRLGIRPLLYAHLGEHLVFASELHSLLCWEPAHGSLSVAGIEAYLSLRYAPASQTMINGVETLPPGCYLTYKNGRLSQKSYWQPHAAIIREHHPSEMISAFKDLFVDAVRLRMRSDVPVGAYLSGGIDSASIVACMQRRTPIPVQTFTIGGFGEGVDETTEAAAIARFIGTNHNELAVDPRQYELLPSIVAGMSRPIGDAIVLPTYLLAKATSGRVKVVLSGEGADEILAGYIHHLTLKNGHDIQRFTPDALMRLASLLVARTPERLLDRLFPYSARLGKKGKKKLFEYLQALADHDVGRQYLHLACLFSESEKQNLLADGDYAGAAGEAFVLGLLRSSLTGDADFFNSLLRYDLTHWLTDYTLAKQDALSMANSLEARVPFLDHRLVEYSLALPGSMLIRGPSNKVILRRAMQGLLPVKTLKARKKAFFIPYETCFDAGFDDFMRDILLSRRCLERGIFNRSYLEKTLDRLRGNELVDSKQIMAIFILELWLRAYLDKTRPTGGGDA